MQKNSTIEKAAIGVEMYIPLFKIGRDRLPDLHLRVQLFHLAPSRIADTLAVHTGRNKKYLQVSPLAFDLQYHTADVLTVIHNTVSLTAINRPLYRLTGNDLSVLFKTVVTFAEFVQCAIIERILIVKDKLFSVGSR